MRKKVLDSLSLRYLPPSFFSEYCFYRNLRNGLSNTDFAFLCVSASLRETALDAFMRVEDAFAHLGRSAVTPVQPFFAAFACLSDHATGVRAGVSMPLPHLNVTLLPQYSGFLRVSA